MLPPSRSAEATGDLYSRMRGRRHGPLMRNREEIEFEFSFVASSAVWTEKRGRASSGRLIQIGGMDFFISFRFRVTGSSARNLKSYPKENSLGNEERPSDQ